MAGLLGALGRLWLAGGDIDWKAFAGGEKRGGRRCRPILSNVKDIGSKPIRRPKPPAERVPGWQESRTGVVLRAIWKQAPAEVAPPGHPGEGGSAGTDWVILGDDDAFAAVLQAALAAENKRCRRIISGPALAENAAGWTVRPESSADYAAVPRRAFAKRACPVCHYRRLERKEIRA